MRTFIFLLTLLIAGNVLAFECTAKRIYDATVLEESFSVEEYPEVSVSSHKVVIGCSTYSAEDGDQILFPATIGFRKTVIVVTSAGEQFLISYEDRPGRREKGEILYRENTSAQYSKLALVSCK